MVRGVKPFWSGLCLMGLVGCTTSNPASREPINDPLVGGPPLRAASNTIAPPPASPSTNGIPALPSPSGPGSPAALASGSGLTSLDPSRELRIGPASSPPRAGAPRSTSQVQLDGPQPTNAGTTATPTRLEGRPNMTLPASVSPWTYEQLKARLIERGLLWIRVENAIEKGEVKVTCFVANREAANVIQSHEVTARDEVSALRAVLDKLDGKTLP